MSAVELVKMCLKQLKRTPARTLLTVLGMVIGVASVIAAFSVGEAGADTVRKEMGKFGFERLYIYPGNARMGSLEEADVDLLLKQVPGICRIASQNTVKAEVKAEGSVCTTDVVATTWQLGEMEDFQLVRGRFLEESDEIKGRSVVVLPEHVKEELFGGRDCLGEGVRLMGKNFTVVGVLKDNTPFYSAVVAPKAYIPLSVYRKFTHSNAIGEISLTAKDQESLAQVTKKSLAVMSRKYGEGGISFLDMSEQWESAQGIIDMVRLLLAAIAGISLVVGGVGIMNIMLVTVRERTREIGIRKALGARNGAILAQFIAEAAAYALIGSAIGVLLGCGITKGAGSLIGIDAAVTTGSILAGVVFSCGVGMGFGFLPALKAARMDPVISLRNS